MIFAVFDALPDRRVVERVFSGSHQLDNRPDHGAALDDEHRSVHFFTDDLVKALDTLAAGELQVGAGLHRIDRPEGRSAAANAASTPPQKPAPASASTSTSINLRKWPMAAVLPALFRTRRPGAVDLLRNLASERQPTEDPRGASTRAVRADDGGLRATHIGASPCLTAPRWQGKMRAGWHEIQGTPGRE